MISGKARIAGVIGWPVSHSLSPTLHQFWLEQYGVDGAYIPLPVKPEDLASAVPMLSAIGLRGFNVTIPHKEAILPLLHTLDESAQKIGSVNMVIINEKGKMHGSNSDAFGFMENIRPALPTARNKAVVLGAGGAAKAVCYSLLALGFSYIILINRTQSKAKAIAQHLGKSVIVGDWQERHHLLSDADILVNATSLGMTGKEPLAINLETLPINALVTDIVYVPLLTPLLVEAKKRGNPIIDGLGMLLYQAVPGFEAWFGLKPEVTPELREHVLRRRI